MTDADARWWALLDKSRRKDLAAYETRLLDALKKLTVPEVVDFDRFVHERIRDAYRADLWEVAYVMNGGCSDDGFDYFVAWLVSRGRDRYEAALASPEAAAKGVSPDDEPYEFEALWYLASRAYAAITGRDDYEAGVAPAVTRTLIGVLPEEDAIVARHPKLAKRFGLG
ncbi:MAG: hypothetical protein JWM10_673 [Myxococcaceae bacterium]|nr:hypothetical protein [Myxococcaceae bacterium]